MTVELRELLGDIRVNLHLSERLQDSALKEASELLRDHRNMLDIGTFQSDLLARERLSCTASGSGLAFPHARTEAVDDIVIAAARSEEGVIFEGRNEPTQLLFIMGTPKDRIADYLVCVASLARALRQEKVRKALLSAETEAEFTGALKAAM